MIYCYACGGARGYHDRWIDKSSYNHRENGVGDLDGEKKAVSLAVGARPAE